MSEKGVAYIKIIISMSIIGVFVALNKVASATLPIFLFSGLRLGIASLILISLLLLKEKRLPIPSKRDAGILFIQAFLGVFLFSIFLLLGSKFTGALESGIITSLTPALVGLISIFIFKEKLNKQQFIGIFLALTGALIINVFGMKLDVSVTVLSVIGNLLIPLAVTGEAFFITFGRLVSKEISPLAISTHVISIGAILFLPLAISDALHFDFSLVTWKDILLVGYSAIVVSVIAVMLIHQSSKVLSGGSTAVFTAFMPVSAICVAFFLFNEKFYWYHGLGVACVLGSILLVSLKQENSRALQKISS